MTEFLTEILLPLLMDCNIDGSVYHLSAQETPPPLLSIVTPHNQRYREPVNSPNSLRFTVFQV
jgi:hypothetical protein